MIRYARYLMQQRRMARCRVTEDAMPQRGVTLIDVEEAIRSLLAAGRAVTARNVRQALGDRGSLTTIVAHMREVRAREEEHRITAGAAHGSALPDSVVQGLVLGAQKHWEALNDAAEAIIAQAQTRAAEQVQEAREGERNAGAAEDAARAEQEKMAAALTETTAELETLQAAHTTLAEEHRARGVALELALERQKGAEALAEERRESIAKTATALAQRETELSNSRDALASACTEADARERSLMQRVAEAQDKHRETEYALADVRQHLSHAEAELERVTGEQASMDCVLNDTRRALESERTDHARTAAELATFRERCDGLRQAVAQSAGHSQSLTAMLERANERAARAEAELQAVEAVKALQRQDSEQDTVTSPS